MTYVSAITTLTVLNVLLPAMPTGRPKVDRPSPAKILTDGYRERSCELPRVAVLVVKVLIGLVTVGEALAFRIPIKPLA